MLFKNILGHKKIKDILLFSVSEQRVPHAQLFMGSKGSANLLLSLAFAQYLSCLNRTKEDACGNCTSCIKHNKFSHPDLHFVFPVTTTNSIKTKPISKNFLKEWRLVLMDNPYISLIDWLNYIGVENKQGIISVEESREIVKVLNLKPFESDKKIMLIWMPEKMNIQAANKLLKLIEEPPNKTYFILVAESTKNIPNTILSRTQILRIPNHRNQDVRNFLIGKGYNRLIAEDISVVVDGDINRAMQLCEESIDLNQNAQSFVKWMRYCYNALKIKDIDKLVHWSESMAKNGREQQKNFLLYASNIIREALMKNYGVDQILKINIDQNNFTLDNFSHFIHAKNCIGIIEELNIASNHIERNANSKILFLDTSFKISRLLHKKLN